MTVRKGLPAKLALTDADDTRFDFNNLVVSDTSGAPRGGITSPVGATIITGTATMNVTVGVFAAVAVRDGGVVLLANDGSVSVLIGAAPGSNQRTDIVYAKQNDASSTVSAPDANNTPVLGVAVGTPGPSGGTPAALPAGAVEIGRIILSAGNATTNAGTISQSGQYTAGPGGIIPVRNSTELDALPKVLGWKAQQIDTGVIYWCDGTSWKIPRSGLNLIRPASVSAGTINHDGSVSLVNVAGAGLNGIFTSEFTNYLIMWDVTKSLAATLGARLRAGGTDAPAANYNTIRPASTLGGTRWLLDLATAAERSYGRMTLYGPALAGFTAGDLAGGGRPSLTFTTAGLDHSISAAYDGLDILPDTGTITGKVWVYGYNNG